MSARKPMKAVVSVAEMARLVGLSRARFYELVQAGVFPPPERAKESGRPLYTAELQKVCLEVRKRSIGVNGDPVLFYTRRRAVRRSRPRKRRRKGRQPKANQYADLVEAVRELGLTAVTSAQVGKSVKALYPQGTAGVDQGEVIRSVFLHLRGKNPAERPL